MVDPTATTEADSRGFRQELEESPVLRAVLEACPVLVAVADEDRRILGLNRAMGLLIDVPAGGATGLLLGEAVGCVNAGKDPRGCGQSTACATCVISATANEALGTGQQVLDREGSVMLFKGGKAHRMGILVSCVPLPLDGVPAVVVTVTDISRLNRLENERRSHLERLSQIGAAAATIVHDLRSPLTGIMGYAQLLERQAQDDHMAEVAGRLNAATRRLGEMVDEILAVAGKDGREPVAKRRMTVEELFARVFTEVRTVNTLNLRPVPGVEVEIDPTAMTRALWNLIKNADEAVGCDGSGSIDLTCEREPRYVVFRVTDQGPGISPEVAATLFEPGATHGKEGGTGFGLYSVKRIVEEHNGAVELRSKPGEGATFEIRLPAY